MKDIYIVKCAFKSTSNIFNIHGVFDDREKAEICTGFTEYYFNQLKNEPCPIKCDDPELPGVLSDEDYEKWDTWITNRSLGNDFAGCFIEIKPLNCYYLDGISHQL